MNYSNGMMGGLQMFIYIIDPPREKCIAKEKAMITEHKRCVIANAKHGIKYRGLYWLDRAAHYRRLIK